MFYLLRICSLATMPCDHDMAPSFEEFDEAAWDFGDELFETWKVRLYDKEELGV